MPDPTLPSDPHLRPQVLHLVAEEQVPFSAELASIDLTELRTACSRLFDQTANAVFRLGLDLDEVVVERLLECRDAGGSTFRCPLVSLTDREALVGVIQAERPSGVPITGIVAAVFANTPESGLP